MLKINNNFRGLNDTLADVTFQAIITAMKDNDNFPAPHPELLAAEAASTAYSTALYESKSGDKTAISEKDKQRAVADLAFFTLGNYVVNVAQDDESIVVSSNYKLRRPNSARPPVTQPEIIRLEPGVNPGDMLVAVARMLSARWYKFEYTLDPESGVWTEVQTTRSKHLLTGLESGKLHYFRVTVYGTNSQQATSNVVSRMLY